MSQKLQQCSKVYSRKTGQATVAPKALCDPVPLTFLTSSPPTSSHTDLSDGPQISQARSHLHFCSFFRNVPPPRQRHSSLPHFLLRAAHLSKGPAQTATRKAAAPITPHPKARLQGPPDSTGCCFFPLLMYLQGINPTRTQGPRG